MPIMEHMMTLGTVLRVNKYRGEAEGFTGKVVEVRDLHAEPVSRQTHRRDIKTRSQFLVTLEAVEKADTVDAFKSFYHAFAEVEVVA